MINIDDIGLLDLAKQAEVIAVINEGIAALERRLEILETLEEQSHE